MAVDRSIMFASPEEVRAAQSNRLERMMELVAQGHPAYRRKLAQAQIRAEDIRTIDDLTRLPLTHKEEYMANPEDFRLQLPDLPGPERTLWDVVYTTGTTTGHPTPLYSTTYDFYNNLEAQRCMAEIRGIDGHDIIANLYPLTAHPHGAFLRANYAAMVLGAPLVAGLPGASYGAFPVHRHLDEVVAVLERSQPTVLWGVPSYLRRVLIRAEEMGVGLPTVRMCTVSGEPCPPGMVAELKSRLLRLGAHDPQINNSLGATEMQAGLVECCEGSGFHNPAPEQYFLEVVDEEGNRLKPGETGLLALTHLDRRGTVLLRYVLGDLVTLTEEPCPHCGRTGGRVVSQPVRTKGLVKIRGMLVNTELINGVLAAVPEAVEYQSVLTKEDPLDPYSMDRLTIRLALAPGVSDGTRSDLASLLAERIKAATGVRPELTFCKPEEIFDPQRQMKPVRFVDQRPRG